MSCNNREVHPGDVLLNVYMKAGDPPMSIADVAKQTGLSEDCIDLLIHCKLTVTPEIAEHLGQIPTTNLSYWLGLQRTYELGVTNGINMVDTSM